MESLLGKLIMTDNKVGRDAIHVAILPVTAKHKLLPGQHIGVEPGTQIASTKVKFIGVVDPFLTNIIKPKDNFYLVLYPGTITSLKHEWTHPDIDLIDTKPGWNSPTDKEWIEEYANSISVDYEDLMSAAHRYLKYGDYWGEGGRFEGEYLPEEFWDHYEKATNSIVKEDDRNSFFSCSC